MVARRLRLVAVYDSETAARRAVRALEQARVGAPARVGDPRDRLASVQSEVRSEAIHGFGVVTKEMASGSIVGGIIGGVIGIVVALPLAALAMASASIWLRILIAIVVGAFVGTTAGWILGAAFAARGPDEPLAAEQGVTVATPLSEDARRVLMTTDPRRIDVVESDDHAVTVVDERPAGPRSTTRAIRRHMRSEQDRR